VSVVSRTRSIAHTGLKVQRRVVLTQALFWPVVLGTALTIGVVTIAVRRAAKSDEPRHAAGEGHHDGQVP
jgi:hypothetical protein